MISSELVRSLSSLGLPTGRFSTALLVPFAVGVKVRYTIYGMTSSSLAELHNRAVRAVRTFSYRGEERIYSLSLRHLVETFSRIHCTLHT